MSTTKRGTLLCRAASISNYEVLRLPRVFAAIAEDLLELIHDNEGIECVRAFRGQGAACDVD